jgi:hypothetical protein
MPDERIRSDEPEPRRRERPDDGDRPPRARDDDDYDDEPRRRRRRYDDEEGDATGGLIPYKNGKALAAYYCGVFALIPCLGMVLGPIALIFGLLGLKYAKEHPRAGGKGHAIAGIVLGSLVLLGHLGVILVFAIAAATH